jgi:alpha-L-fucosidase
MRFPSDTGDGQDNGVVPDANRKRSLHHGDKPDGDAPRVWRPAEADVSIRPGWFYHPDQDEKVRSVENLMDLYCRSVGRNSLIHLNVPPTPEGLFPEIDTERLRDFRAAITRVLGNNLADGATVRASSTHSGTSAAAVLDASLDSCWAAATNEAGAWIELSLPARRTFDTIGLQEPLRLGQRIEQFTVDAIIDDQWTTLASGSTIGHKRILRLDAPATSDRVRLTIHSALAIPAISRIGLYSMRS